MVKVDLTNEEVQLLDAIFKEVRLPIDTARIALILRDKIFTAWKNDLEKQDTKKK